MNSITKAAPSSAMIGEEEEEGDGCERNGEKKEAAIVKRASTEIMSK